MKVEIKKMFGERPLENPDYPRLISEKAFNRMLNYLENKIPVSGGNHDRKNLMIEPTIIEADENDSCMKEEIFGPVLPLMTFSDLDQVMEFINVRPKPLSIYYYSKDRKNQRKMLKETSSGALLINEIMVHFANNYLPFGGVGESGIGRYHGKESFRVFSNIKAVMKNRMGIDFPLRYPPFGKKERIIRKLIR